ncbi:uncharacterized protein LOC129792512 [Lutzomyia longipalpis]|nr:uncharacterized protein LOC129792512 [Lutzomyia longipalpis]
MGFLGGKSYKSKCCEGGFELQNHLMLYSCAKLRKMGCQSFSVGYEVEEFTKFDDVVCGFELNESKYLFPIQAKFVQRNEKKISQSDFITNKGKINLKKHIEGIMDFQRHTQGRQVRYIIATTAPMNMYMKNIRFKSLKMKENQLIVNIADLLIDSGAKVLQIDSQFEKFEEILQKLEVDLNITRIALDGILNRLIFLTEVPKKDNFLEIIKNLLIDVNVVNRESFFQVIQNRTTNYVEYDKATHERRVISKHTFDILLRGSVLEVDLKRISESFLSEIALSIEFERHFLEEIWKSLQNSSKFVNCEENVNLTALKVWHSVKMANGDAILVPISKLNDFHIESLSFYEEKERNIVILVDNEMNYEDLVKKPNIYFVGKIQKLSFVAKLPSFSYDELTVNAKQEFEEKIIKIQNFPLQLKHIPKNGSKDYKELFEKFFVHFCDGKLMEIGGKIPENPHPHIERRFKDEIYEVSENKVFAKYSKCIIMGLPGMGKSFTLKNMTKKFKQKQPNFWIEFIQLNLLGSIFEKLTKNKNNLTEGDAKEIFFDEILSCKEKSLLLERELIEYYLTLEFPPIILIFDGFDEIMPTYEKVVFNFIQKLIGLKVQIVISGRPHCETILKDLKEFRKFEICSYSKRQLESFIQKYYEYKKESCKSSEELHESFDSFNETLKHMIEKSKVLEQFPLYLTLLSDIAFHMQENPEKVFDKSNQIDISWIYNEIFELSFVNYLREKEGNDPLKNSTKLKNDRMKKNLISHYFCIACMEMSIDMNLPQLPDLSEEEILAPGFLKKVSVNKFVFIHRTFAEYFLGLWLIECLESNVDEFLNSVKEYYKFFPVMRFLCLLLANKIKKNEIILNIPEKNCKRRKLFVKFFNQVAEFCWDYELTEHFDVIIIYTVNEFSQDGLKFLDKKNKFRLWSLHDTSLTTMKIEWIYKLRNKDFSYFKLFEEFSRNLEKNLIKQLVFKDFESFRKTNAIVEKYSDSFKEFLQKLTEEIIEQLRSSWLYKCDNFFWCIWKIFINSEDSKYFLKETLELLNKLKLNQDLKEKCDFLVTIISKSETDKSSTFKEFIKDIFDILSSDEIFKFFKVFNRNSFVYNEGFYNFNEICKNYAQKLILTDNNSIIFHFYIEKDKDKMLDFVRNFSDELFTNLTESPHFGGKSLEEYYKESEEKEDVCLDILFFWYIRLNKITDFFWKYQNGTNISRALEKNLRLCISLDLNMKNEFTEENVTNVIDTFCQNILNWEKESGTKVNFLHCLAKANKAFICTKAYFYFFEEEFEAHRCMLRHIFRYLKEIKSREENEDNLLVEKIYERDNDGNIPIQICVLENNLPFIDVILTFVDKKMWYDLFSRKNNKNQNFFHCFNTKTFTWSTFIWSTFTLNDIPIISYNSFYEKLFLERDIDGKTPFHSIKFFGSPFEGWLSNLSNETFTSLLQIKDNGGNNILHYMAKHNQDYSIQIQTLKTHIEINSVTHTPIKNALKCKNNSNKTPLDVCKNCTYCTPKIYPITVCCCVFETTYCDMEKEFQKILKEI